MPCDMLNTDVLFPAFTIKDTPEQKVDQIMDYLYMLREQLRYSMYNLGSGNFNETALNDIADAIRKPVYMDLKDINGNINQIVVDAEGLALRVTNAENDITQIVVAAEGLSTRVTNAEGDISTLTQTAEGISTEVSSIKTSTSEGFTAVNSDISTLKQTATNIETEVSNLSTSTQNGFTEVKNSISTIEQDASSIALRVTTTETDITGHSEKISALELSSNEISTTVSGHTTTLSTHTQNISTLTQTASGIQTQVTSLKTSTQNGFTEVKNSISTVGQTADKIYWLINSGGTSSNFTLTSRAAKLVADEIDLTGYVTISSLGSRGSTTIDGSRITTGTISADHLDLRGVLTASDVGASGNTVISGNRITTGTISAKYIDADNLKIKKVYNSGGTKAVISTTTNTTTIDCDYFTSNWISMDKWDGIVLGKLNCPVKIGVNAYSNGSRIGFFGSNPVARQRISTGNTDFTLSNLCHALKAYGLITF